MASATPPSRKKCSDRAAQKAAKTEQNYDKDKNQFSNIALSSYQRYLTLT